MAAGWRETRATYFSVDIECNGPVPGLYDMVSIGIVAVQPDAEGALQIGPSLYLELKPEAPRVDPHAEKIHGLTLEHLHANGLPRRVVMEQIRDWVKAHTVAGTKPVFVGHNAPFDWSFVSWCYAAEELPNPFGYKALDTKALATGKLHLHWFDSSKEVLHERLGIVAEDMNLKHRADYDAAYQADLLIRLLNFSS